MKRIFAMLLSALLAASLLSGCGEKPLFGVSTEDDNSISVTAVKAPDGSLGLGYLTVGERDEVVVESTIQGGQLRLRYMRGVLGSEDFPDEPTAESTITEGVMRITIEPGEYTVGVIAEGKPDGEARIYTEAIVQSLEDDLGYSPDDMAGVWAEKIAGRGNVEIRKGEAGDGYEVLITWGSSAEETYVWTMTARAEGSNLLRYEDARHSILHFHEDGTDSEEPVYENGTGSFSLNSAYELMWQDDVEDAGLDTVFVRAD